MMKKLRFILIGIVILIALFYFVLFFILFHLYCNRQIMMRSDIKLPQPFASWSNSL